MVMMEVGAMVVVRKGPENGEEDLPWERYHISLDQYHHQILLRISSPSHGRCVSERRSIPLNLPARARARARAFPAREVAIPVLPA
jgi:hypothetical protein